MLEAFKQLLYLYRSDKKLVFGVGEVGEVWGFSMSIVLAV